MNVLHFSLGLPPYKSGGLTRYATDLIVAEKNAGLNVSLIYPGDFTFWKSHHPYIAKEKDFSGVQVYEIKNPPPVPLFYGVRKPSDIYDAPDLKEKVLDVLYEHIKPDVFHVHTLMGLPVSLLDFLKRKGVKLIYSTHDYYGLCLRTNFVNQYNELCPKATAEVCARCNRNAPGTTFLRFRNSKYILRYKSLIRNKIKLSNTSNTAKREDSSIPEQSAEVYGRLLKYYRDVFNRFDFFHFNSRVTEQVYREYLSVKHSKVIPISHAGISDQRGLKTFNKTKIRIAFIGNAAAYKGFPLLRKVLINLFEKGITNWELSVWGSGNGIDPECSLIRYRGKYSEAELKAVFQETDLMVIPSMWRETFSFVALEAISFGVPVLVTESVGAKDIVRKYSSDFVIPYGEKVLLDTIYELLQPEDHRLEAFNRAIINSDFQYGLDGHLKEIIQLYNQMKYL